MKITIGFYGAAIILLATAWASRAGIIAGPITNPGNGHDYYLLTPNTWTASEAEAESLGGTLAVIRNAAEQEWVASKFSTIGGTNRNLWIGLHRQRPGGPFAWPTGEKVDYANWAVNQPDNAGGNESYVHLFANNPGRVPGTWNDLADVNSIDDVQNCGAVEVPGKSEEKSLTEKEKSLIGTWYVHGRTDHLCWISGTENMLFVIYDGHASRLIYTSTGDVMAINPQEGIYGEIIKDRILWADGNWWSRKPVQYNPGGKSSDTTEAEIQTDKKDKL